jgi:hypothetical protein
MEIIGIKKKPAEGEPPVSNPFKQQKLPAWQPILTPKAVIISFFIIGLVFVPLGIGLVFSSNMVSEYQSSAYEVCPEKGETYCPLINVSFPNLDLQPPIFMYYKLENFYQNHRRYARSRNDVQLRGIEITSKLTLVDCDPVVSLNNSDNPEDIYFPCGLIAKGLFNDTFKLFHSNGTQIALSMENIAWESDVNTKFNNPPNTTRGIRVIPDLKNPDFINWMRVAGLPTFRKLYRIIDVPLVGDFTVQIANNFPVTSFNGHKYVVLSTTSWLGGKNPFLGYAYIVVGAVCVILAVIFLLKQVIRPRVQGDTTYLIWAKS